MKKKHKPAKKAKKISKKKGSAPRNSNLSGIAPLGDRVVLKPLSKEEGQTTSFGIIIPETIDKEKPEQGVVIAVGPGKLGDDNKIIPVSVKVGDRVMFSKYGFDEVKVNGIEYYIVSENNILAVLK